LQRCKPRGQKGKNHTTEEEEVHDGKDHREENKARKTKKTGERIRAKAPTKEENSASRMKRKKGKTRAAPSGDPLRSRRKSSSPQGRLEEKVKEPASPAEKKKDFSPHPGEKENSGRVK